MVSLGKLATISKCLAVQYVGDGFVRLGLGPFFFIVLYQMALVPNYDLAMGYAGVCS